MFLFCLRETFFILHVSRCPTKFETRWLQEIPFSKELTDNYCALGLLFESITCNNNNNKHHFTLRVKYIKLHFVVFSTSSSIGLDYFLLIRWWFLERRTEGDNMPCDVILPCHDIPCWYFPVMSCHVMSCRVVSCRVVSCLVVSCRVVSCRVVSCRVVSCRVVSCRVVSCRVVSCRVVSCRVMSWHGMAWHGMACHSMSCHKITGMFIWIGFLFFLHFQPSRMIVPDDRLKELEVYYNYYKII